MKLSALHAYTRQKLRGHYRRALVSALWYPGAVLVLTGMPFILAVYAAHCSRMTPQALLYGREPAWQMLALLWYTVRLCLLVPVGMAVCGWFAALCGLEEHPARCFPDTGAYLRAVWCFLLTRLTRAAALLPCALLCTGGILALRRCSGSGEDVWRLLLAAQCLAGAVWAGIGYLRLCIGLAAVPAVRLYRPWMPAHRCIRDACCMLKGRHGQLMRIAAWYLPAALPGVTIPFLLPPLACDMTVFLQIRIREYYQEAGS